MLDHPLNRGVVADLLAAQAQNLIDRSNERSGVLFWLGCCNALMSALVITASDYTASLALLADMLRLGLRGLGAAPANIASLTDTTALAARLDQALAEPIDDQGKG
jgi:hypothetical protein